MAETLSAQLTRVQAAIAAIEEGAQEYQIGTKKLRRADLPALYARERSLLSRIAEEDAGGLTAYIGRPE